MIEIIDIKNSLKSERVTNISSEELIKILFNSILKVYILHGLMRSRPENEIKAEIAIFAEQIKQDILSDSKLMNLHVKEIDLIFKGGLNDEFDKVEWINYTTIKRWINSYLFSPERKDAIQNFESNLELKQLSSNTEFSENDIDNFMQSKINENYAKFLTNSDEIYIDVEKLIGLKLGQKDRRCGQIIDYGEAKNNYLIKKGLKNNSESLLEFYNRMKNLNKTRIF